MPVATIGPLFESTPRPLLKSGMQSVGRYGTHQETISRTDLTRCILHLRQGWNGLGGAIIQVGLE